MKNKYEIRGDVTAIFLKRKDGAILESLIDTADLNKVDMHAGTWYPKLSADKKCFYCAGNVGGRKAHKTIKLHRYIMNSDNLSVDHINHNTLDNRRSCNLREVTHRQNMQNRKGANANSASGVHGVHWKKSHKKWHAQLRVNGKNKSLGYFDDLLKAEIAIKDFEAKHMPFSQEAREKDIS